MQNMYSIRKKFPANTNTIRFEKITRIRIRIIFGLKNYPNTNNIRFEKITRIRIRIIFGFKKSAEYEYEYEYKNSASSIQIIFEYRIIRSPLFTSSTDVPTFSSSYFLLRDLWFECAMPPVLVILESRSCSSHLEDCWQCSASATLSFCLLVEPDLESLLLGGDLEFLFTIFLVLLIVLRDLELLLGEFDLWFLLVERDPKLLVM